MCLYINAYIYTYHGHLKVFVRIFSVSDLVNTLKPKRYNIVCITGQTTLKFIVISFAERVPGSVIKPCLLRSTFCDLLRTYKIKYHC